MASTDLKTALITGASSGIGYELAKLFVRDKYRVILVSSDQSQLEEVAQGFKEQFLWPEIIAIAKDLSKPGSAKELFDEVKQKYQLQINILVNDAGTAIRGKIWETDIQKDLEIIQVNIASMVELTKLILPEMIQRNEGKILMLGSTASSQPGPLMASYAATKAFVASYTDALIDELKETNVTATLLIPGITDTNIYNKMDAENTNAANSSLSDDPADVARRGYEALMKGEHRAYGSTKVKLIVGVGQILPNELVTKVSHTFMNEQK